jgi:hypothetical protein
MTGTYKRIDKIALSAVCLVLITTACKKDPVKEEPTSPITIPKVMPKGQPLESGVVKPVGPAGGTVSSADQSVTITIPAGALTTNTNIGIQPVSNTNLAGKGTAFRLTPHGQQFAKPVTIRYNYTALKDSFAFPLSVGLSFQDEAGVWQMPGNSTVDTAAKKVSYQTTHFSDWALMERVSLRPVSSSLGEGEKLNIEALLYNAVPNPCNCLRDLLTPLTPAGPYPVGEPAPLPSKYIKSWKLIGPGSLSQTTGNKVEYRAPAKITNPATATVVAQLNGPDQGEYLLLANISLVGDGWIELSIGGAPVKSFPATPVVRRGNQYLLSNPEDEGGGYFGLKWIGGVGAHAFDLDNGTTWHYNAPDISYVSMYLPGKDEELKPSGGAVTITKLSNGIAEGSFNVTNAGYGNFLTTTTATGKFRVKLVD